MQCQQPAAYLPDQLLPGAFFKRTAHRFVKLLIKGIFIRHIQSVTIRIADKFSIPFCLYRVAELAEKYDLSDLICLEAE